MSQAVDNSTRALAQTGAQLQKLLVALPATVDAQLAAIQENANLIADQVSGELLSTYGFPNRLMRQVRQCVQQPCLVLIRLQA